MVLHGGHLTLQASLSVTGARCKLRKRVLNSRFQLLPYVNISLQPTDDDLLLYYWLQPITLTLSIINNFIK